MGRETPRTEQFPDIYNLNQQKLAQRSKMYKVGICPSEDSSMIGTGE